MGHDAPPSSMLVDLKDSIATKFMPAVIQEFRYGKKDFLVLDDSHEVHSVSLICDKRVTTQNLALSSYRYRKKCLHVQF